MFFSCDNSSTKKPEIVKNECIAVDTIDTTNPHPKLIDNSRPIIEQESDSITKIKFPELTLTIRKLVIWNEEQELNKAQKDTVNFYLELGETIEGQLLSISTNELTDIQVEQRYETSVTIMNEGPHCDLIDWKHYYSDWIQLKKNNKGLFVCDSYEESDWEKFPKIDIEELKEAVKTHCSEHWYDLVKNIKSPTEYPSGVGISRYFLRVTGKQKDNEQKVIKLIILETPMGC